MQYDVVIVGAGPAGLAAAIRLKQRALTAKNAEVSICIVEKAAEVGGHILSGAAFEPEALSALLPDWRDDETCPLKVPITQDRFYYLTKKTCLSSASAAAHEQSWQLYDFPCQPVSLACRQSRSIWASRFTRVLQQQRFSSTRKTTSSALKRGRWGSTRTATRPPTSKTAPRLDCPADHPCRRRAWLINETSHRYVRLASPRPPDVCSGLERAVGSRP